jgi:hypothetical protein
MSDTILASFVSLRTRAAQGRRPIMWRKTVWLIAALTLSIFVAPIAAKEGWAQNPGKVYRVGVVLVLPPNLLPPNASRPSFPAGPLARALLDRLADHGYVEERTSSSKRGSEDTSDWRNLQRS